jgi:hypothetical protein
MLAAHDTSLVQESNESGVLVLTSDTVRVLSRWMLGICAIAVSCIYSSHERQSWW